MLQKHLISRALALETFVASYASAKHYSCQFAVWMFYYRGLSFQTIKTYIAGVSFILFVNHLIPATLWHPHLNRIVKGIERECAMESPIYRHTKLPFTRNMAAIALEHILDNGSIFELRAIYAAICLALMFLFRRSEFLTDARGQGKVVDGKTVTLLSDDVFLWYGDVAYPAHSKRIPLAPPEFLSMFLPRSKGDPMGKGATRFFPANPNCSTCLVKIVHAYLLEANLSPGQHLFAGPKFVVSIDIFSQTLKATATYIGLPANRVSIHSVRVGGLVALFAANVPDDAKMLAGRWASNLSFIAYARATMQQYTWIASALNDVNLVTADHVRKFYNN